MRRLLARRRSVAPPADPASGRPYPYKISDDSNPFDIRRLLIGCAITVTQGAPRAGARVKIADRWYQVTVEADG
jgi:hypothetical protein